MTRAIDTVLFDLDDTLHDDSHAYRSATADVVRELVARYGIDGAALSRAFLDEVDEFWLILTAEHLKGPLEEMRAGMWGRALAAVGLTDPAIAAWTVQTYARARAGYYAPFPGALAMLAALRARGIKTGLITNGFAHTHREKIVQLGFAPLLDAIVIADEVGMLKPDPAIFIHTCTLLDRTPATSAMVGDRYFRDIVGAHEAGLLTVYLAIREEGIPADAPPDITIHAIDELLAVLPLSQAPPRGVHRASENSASQPR